MNIEKEKNELWYDENKIAYEQFAQKISDLLKTLIEEEGIAYHSIAHRVKTRESYIEKIRRKNYDNPAEKIMDLAGIRIIAYTVADVNKICSLIKNEFCVDEHNSGNKAELLKSDKVGYLSIHYIVGLSTKRLVLREYSRFSSLLCEIQVRTLLQHAWAEIEHDRSYKFSGVLPENIRRRFHLIAGVLEMVDSEFQRLSDEIDLHIETVKEDTEKGMLDIPLDSTSLIEFISSRIKKGDIAKHFHDNDKEIIDELHAFGINSIADLSRILNEKFCEEYNKYALSVEISNYLGLLRDAMICYDAKLYFNEAWGRQWGYYDMDSFSFWTKYGVNLSIVKEFLQPDIEDYDEDGEDDGILF